MRFALTLIACCTLSWMPCAAEAPAGDGVLRLEPPVAKQVPQRLEQHGDVRIDDYYWLKERDNPEVLAYLEAENAYTASVMDHTGPLQQTLFQEFKQRIKQTDVTVPYRKDDYFYYSRTEEGQDYPIHCRKKQSLEAPEEIVLDVNALARGHQYCSASVADVSHGQQLVAYAVDTVGRRFYNLHVKNLASGEVLEDVIPDVTGDAVWANDDRTLFYTKQDPTTLRPYRVYRHVLGTDPAADDLVYEETDETFGCGVSKTKSEEYLLIGCDQTLSSEYRYLDADEPEGEPKVFEPRRRDHEYSIDHHAGHFFVRTNHEAKNFRLMKTPVDHTSLEHWTEVLPHRADVLLEDFELFRDHLVAEERKDGLLRLRIMPWSGGKEHYVDFGEPAYVAFPSSNYELNTGVLRFVYSSMTTPRSVYDYDMTTREQTLLKRDEVGGFDPRSYKTERLNVKVRDGERVPVSLVYKLPFRKDGKRPLVLYGYGSYGLSLDAGFDAFRISLLDRGFVYAIAHVRGGQERGRHWYEDGKLLAKKNTFNDFIDCAEHLARAKYADPRRLYAWGGSAGGLLVGAVVTMRPELFHGAIAEVPFLDVVTTMLDDEIPLTSAEYDEWGDPHDKKYYDYMLSYSPYDQTPAASYPHLLVTTGLHDSQVQYWEPAKWVAKLRVQQKGDSALLLKTDMGAGHGGLSARDDRYREKAFRYAFLLDVAER